MFGMMGEDVVDLIDVDCVVGCFVLLYEEIVGLVVEIVQGQVVDFIFGGGVEVGEIYQ